MKSLRRWFRKTPAAVESWTISSERLARERWLSPSASEHIVDYSTRNTLDCAGFLRQLSLLDHRARAGERYATNVLRAVLRKNLRVLGSDRGQDIAEYAVMLAVILVIVVGTIRLIGTNANQAFSSVASSIQ